MVSWAPSSRQILSKLKNQLHEILRPRLLHCCTHVKTHGGVKRAIKTVQRILPHSQHAARFDIYHYYQSIRHDVLLNQLKQFGVNAEAFQLVKIYLSMPDTDNTGVGLLAGGSLSSILAALYLDPLDKVMHQLWRKKKIVSYVRYMDDMIILCQSRWALKKAIVKMYRVLKSLHLSLHPNKQSIGRVSKGFDFLGYQFQVGRKLRPSKESYRRLRINARRLYEREADTDQLLRYLKRWQQWIFAGLNKQVSLQGGLRRITRYILSYLKIKIDKSQV